MAGSKAAREQKMREVIARQQASGLTQRAFAASIEMKMTTFAWWKREISRRDRQRAQPAHAAPSPTFLPVEVIEPAPIATSIAPLAVHLGDLRISVPREFDAAHLRRVVAAMRAC